MDTITNTRSYSNNRESLVQGPQGLMYDWPYVAPAMAFILTSAAAVVACMFFAERFFVG